MRLLKSRAVGIPHILRQNYRFRGRALHPPSSAASFSAPPLLQESVPSPIHATTPPHLSVPHRIRVDPLPIASIPYRSRAKALHTGPIASPSHAKPPLIIPLPHRIFIKSPLTDLIKNPTSSFNPLTTNAFQSKISNPQPPWPAIHSLIHSTASSPSPPT